MHFRSVEPQSISRCVDGQLTPIRLADLKADDIFMVSEFNDPVFYRAICNPRLDFNRKDDAPRVSVLAVPLSVFAIQEE